MYLKLRKGKSRPIQYRVSTRAAFYKIYSYFNLKESFFHTGIADLNALGKNKVKATGDYCKVNAAC